MSDIPPLQLSTFLIFFIYAIAISVFLVLIWMFKIYFSYKYESKLKSSILNLENKLKRESKLYKKVVFKIRLTILETVIKL